MLSHFTFHIICSRRIDPVDTNPGRKSAWRVLLLISYVIAVCVLQVGIFMPARGSSFFIGQLCQRSQHCGRWQYRYERSVRSDPIHRIHVRLHLLVSGLWHRTRRLVRPLPEECCSRPIQSHRVGPRSVLTYWPYFLTRRITFAPRTSWCRRMRTLCLAIPHGRHNHRPLYIDTFSAKCCTISKIFFRRKDSPIPLPKNIA